MSYPCDFSTLDNYTNAETKNVNVFVHTTDHARDRAYQRSRLLGYETAVSLIAYVAELVERDVRRQRLCDRFGDDAAHQEINSLIEAPDGQLHVPYVVLPASTETSVYVNVKSIVPGHAPPENVTATHSNQRALRRAARNRKYSSLCWAKSFYH